MSIVTAKNVAADVTEGQTLKVANQAGVLIGDSDASGYALAVSAVSNGSTSATIPSGGTATIQGLYGTLVLQTNGGYKYVANGNISFPGGNDVEDIFTFTVKDTHGNASQATLTLTVAPTNNGTITVGDASTVIDASAGNETVVAGNGDNTITGGPNDKIMTGNGKNTITAGANDVIKAGTGNNTITGAANDDITVGRGNNTITGGAHNTITVGNGSNIITVGSDNDVRLGTGANTLIFKQTAPSQFGNVTIEGFDPSRDVIQFDTSVFANFAAVKAHAKHINGNTVITLDNNDTITLTGIYLSSLQASEFAFASSSGATVTIDPVDGNNVINYAEAHAAGGVPLAGTVSGVAANSTFTVTVADNGVTHTYTATVNGAGTAWSASIPMADAVALANGSATVTAQIDPSTQASVNVTVAETLPTVSIAPVDGSNVINYAEAHAAGGVPLTGAVSGLAANSTFSVSVTDNGVTKSYTAAVNGAGTAWSATIPMADAVGLANGSATVSAQVTDAYGNQSNLAWQLVTVAETLPTVSIDPVDGNDVINYAEAHTAGGVPLTGVVSGLAANSTFSVSVTDNGVTKSYTATVNGAGTAWSAAIPMTDAVALANGSATVSAQVTDTYGNQSTLASQLVTVAETLPTVSINPVDGNDVINYAEAHAAGGVPLSGTVSGVAANSTFSVSVTDNGVTNSYTATVNGAGTAWSASIPMTDAVALANGSATVSVLVTDAYGNQSAPASDPVTVAETLPTVSIDPVEGNNVINYAEAHDPGGVPLSGSVTGIAANASFTVTVTDDGVTKSYTATVNGAGSAWSATIPSSDAIALANGSATVSAQVTDVYGNQSALATQFVSVAATAPTVSIDPVDGNNVINYAEAHAAGGVPLSGSVGGIDANATFTVTVTDNGVTNSYTATVNGAANAWAATIPMTDAVALANGSATVSAQVTDTFGNQSAIATQLVTVAETLPTVAIDPVDGSNLINYAEAYVAGGVLLSGTVSGLAADSTFSVSVTDNGVVNTYTATVDGAGTAWSATIPMADAVALADGTATVSTQITDAYGNQSDIASELVTVAETLPTVSINLVDGNNVINYAEAHAAGGVPLSGSVSGVAANSTFSVTVSDNGVVNTYTATVDGAGTAWSATIPMTDAVALANGSATVSAQVTDGYGNQSALATQIVGVGEFVPTVSIDSVTGDDVVTPAEAAAGFAITGSTTDIADGTFVTVDIVNAASAVVDSYQALVTGGAWSATVSAGDATGLGNGSYTTTADVTDAYGNSAAEASEPFTVQVPLSAPVFDLAKTDQVGPAGSHETQSANVTLVGTTGAGDTLTLAGTGATTIADNLGNFQFTNVAVGLGDNFLTVQVSDNDGNTNQATVDVQRLAPSGQANQAVNWNQIALKAITNDASIPEFAARALAMESLAVYNAISAIDGTKGYLFNATAAADASPDAAVAQAAHDVLAALYPAQKAALDALLAQSLSGIPDGQGKIDGIALGATVAAEIVALRANDGWNDVVIDNGSEAVGEWRPTPPAFAPAQGGQYANMTPFAMTSPDQFLPPPPPDLTSAEYAAALEEDRLLGSATNSTRTADQTQIAKFWNDGAGTYTPPGQWNSIADQVATAEGDSLSADALLFAKLNVAEADTAIGVWNAKFDYNLWRPVTAIQNADQIGNPDLTEDPNWMPLLNTPNFPSYVSGHSAFSAAAAEVLASIFGDNYAFSYTDPTQGSLPGTTRSYASFEDAAQEAGISRIYGGIHYSFDNTAGQTLGTQVADWTLQVFDQTTDTTPPQITIDQSSGFVTKSSPVITGHVSDNLSGVVALMGSFDGQPFAPVSFDPSTGAFSLPSGFAVDGSADGNHSVSLTAFDAAGNESQISAQTFRLDTAAPAITLAPTSVQPNGTLFDGEHLAGTADPTGSSLVSLTYAFDGGTANPVTFNAFTGAFDVPLDYSKLSLGTHTLDISATDAAGNGTTDSLQVNVDTLPALTITSVSPALSAVDVGVTFRPQIKFSRAVDVSTLTSSTFFATDSTGTVIPATVVPFTDGTGAWMLFNGPMPGASTITLHVDGTDIKAADGAMLDAADTGVPGSAFTETFSTVSTAGVPGTTISGIVADPGPDFTPMTPDDVKAGANGINDFIHDTFKLPIAGVKVFILGHEDEAVYTDASGNFSLTDVPSGDVKVEFDGTTATNAPGGFYFPTMVMDVHVQPGVANTVMGGMGDLATQAINATNPVVYLPRLSTAILQPVSDTVPTVITAPVDSSGSSGLNLTPEQAGEITLTVQPGSLVDENGNPVANAQIGISTVPASIVMDMLPTGILQHSFDITIQAPGGTVFTTAAKLTLPNVLGLAPGSKTDLLSFDHTTGRLVIDGTATVSADGLTVTSDPDSGVLAPGWHTITNPGSQVHTNVNEKKEDSPPGSAGERNAVNTARSWYSVAERGAANLAEKGLVIGVNTLAKAGGRVLPVAGAIFSAAQADQDSQDYSKDINDINTNGLNVSNGFSALENGTKYMLDKGQEVLGAGVEIPIIGEGTEVAKDILSLGSDALTIADGARDLGKAGLNWFDSTVETYYAGTKDAHQDTSKPNNSNSEDPDDPTLIVNVSKNGLDGAVDVYVDGVLATTATVTASHQDGDTQAITITGILGADYHDIQVVSTGPTSGLTSNTQNDVFIDGVNFNGQDYAFTADLYGLDTDRSADFSVGSAVTAVESTYESLLQRAHAEAEFDAAVYPLLIAGDEATANFINAIDPNNSNNFGLSQSFMQTQLDAMNAGVAAAQLLDGHPSSPELTQQSIDAAQAYDDQLTSELYTPVGSGPSDPGTSNFNGVAVSPDATLYAAIDDFSGNVQRVSFNASQGLDVFMAADTRYELTVYDPTSNEIGEALYTSGDAGSTIDTPNIDVGPDPDPAMANGLGSTANFVLGLNGNNPDNLVAGVSDRQAIQDGLYTNPQLAAKTGLVAILPLQGQATAIALTSPTSAQGAQLAYIATGTYGLAIVDTSNRLTPKILSQYQLNGVATSVAVDTSLQLAVVALGNGIVVFDVSDPKNPALLYSRSMQASQVATANGYIYAQNNGTLQQIDFATGNLTSVTPIDASAVNGLLVQGSDLFVMHASGLLQVLDISGAAPSLIGSLSLSANAGKMEYSNGVLFVGDGTSAGQGGYTTIDVSNPAAPTLITNGQTNFPQAGVAGGSLALTGSGTAAFVQDVNVSGGNLTHVFDYVDVSDPSVTTAELARYTLPAQPYDVAIGSGTAFIADGTSGLAVVSYASPDTAGIPPVVSIASPPGDVDPNTAGLQLFEGQTITITANATDDGQIARVELLINGQSVQTDVGYPWTLSGVLPSLANNGGTSTVTIQVRATDTGGNVGLSAPITAQLVANNAPFAVAKISPASGASLNGTQRHITVTFNESVNPISVNASTFVLTDSSNNVIAPTSVNIPTGGTTVDLVFDALAAGSYTETIDAPDVFNTLGEALGTVPITTQFTVVPYDDVWTGNGNGDWSDGNNWSTFAPPISTAKVLVPVVSGTQAVISTNIGPINSITITGAGQLVLPTPSGNGSGGSIETNVLDNSSTVSIQRGTFSVDGTLHNSSAILIDAQGSDSAILTSNVAHLVIDGGGTITLSNTLPLFNVSGQLNTGNDRLEGMDPDQDNPLTTIENVDNTISGTGHIGFVADEEDNNGVPLPGEEFINDANGVVDITGDDYLEINSKSVVNHGIMEQHGSDPFIGSFLDFSTHYEIAGIGFATLYQRGVDLDNTDGTIIASGNGSIDFLGTIIHGGTLQSKDGGSLWFLKSGLSAATQSKGVSNAAEIDGTTSMVSIVGDDAATLGSSFVLDETFIQGTIFNHSYMRIIGSYTTQPGFQNRTGALALSDDATLEGGGTIDLERPGNALSHNLDVGIIAEFNTPYTLTNLDNTISGAGTIGYSPFIHASVQVKTSFNLDNAADGRIIASAQANPNDDQFAERMDIVDVTLTNDGLVSAQASGGMLIDNTTIDNTFGTLSAVSGDTTFMDIIDNSSVSGGDVVADGQSVTILVDFSTISDANVSAIDGASITFTDGSTLTDDTITADSSGSSITVDGTDVSGGTIGAEADSTTVTIEDSSSLSGTAVVAAGDGASVSISDSAIDGGLVAVESAGAIVTITNSTITNATIEVDSGGTLSLTGNYDATNDVFTGSGGHIQIADSSSLQTAGVFNVDDVVSFGANSTMELDQFQSGTVAFGSTDLVNIDESNPTTGTFVNFMSGNQIDLYDMVQVIVGWNYVGDSMSGQLEVYDGFGHDAFINLAFNAPVAFADDPNTDFFLNDDTNGGTTITDDLTFAAPGNTYDNFGPLNVGPGGDVDNILVPVDTTLDGGGSVDLIGGGIVSDQSLIDSGQTATVTNLDNTISGSGQLGDDNLNLFNSSGGTILANSGDNISIYAPNTRNVGLIEANGGFIYANNVDDWYGQGVVSAQNGGYVAISGNLQGNGQNSIGDNSTIEAWTIQNGNTTFTSNTGQLVIDHASDPAFPGGSVSNFMQGDQIDLRDIFGDNATLDYQGTTAGGTLTINDGVNNATLLLFGNYMASFGEPDAVHFATATDFQGGTIITTDIVHPHA